MPPYDTTKNPITQLKEEVGPLLEAADVPFFGDTKIQVFDVLDKENRAYPFVTFGLGARGQNGAVIVYVNGHVAGESDPGVHELGAAVEQVIRDAILDRSHPLLYLRSERLVRMEGHATITVFGHYPKWK